MELLINNRQISFEISEHFKERIFKAIGICIDLENYNKDVEVSISFVDNDEIKSINNEFRNIDEITDVLSFPMNQDFIIEGENEILGDIIISIPKAIEQSIEYGHSIEREIIYLVIHSMFHLLGYDHMNEFEQIEMRSKEKKAIRKLGLFKNER